MLTAGTKRAIAYRSPSLNYAFHKTKVPVTVASCVHLPTWIGIILGPPSSLALFANRNILWQFMSTLRSLTTRERLCKPENRCTTPGTLPLTQHAPSISGGSSFKPLTRVQWDPQIISSRRGRCVTRNVRIQGDQRLSGPCTRTTIPRDGL